MHTIIPFFLAPFVFGQTTVDLTSGVLELVSPSLDNPAKLWIVGQREVPPDARVLWEVGSDYSLVKADAEDFSGIQAGELTPALKISPSLADLEAGSEITVLALVYGRLDLVANEIGRRMGAAQVEVFSGGRYSPQIQPKILRLRIDSGLIPVLASRDYIIWLERYSAPSPMNSDSVSPIQANVASSDLLPSATPIWDQGLMGSNQIVAILDTGVDINEDWFAQLDQGAGPVTTDVEPELIVTGNENFIPNSDQKIAGYWVGKGASPFDDNSICISKANGYHGTHVAGTVAGDAGVRSTPDMPSHDFGDGMAPQAQLLVLDLGNAETGCLNDAEILDMWRRAGNGASVLLTAIGSANIGHYNLQDHLTDWYHYRATYDLGVLPAGNTGSANLGNNISHYGLAKNGLTVGALGHGSSEVAWNMSSRGPTNDYRVKPDVALPGVAIASAAGDDNSTGFEPPQIRIETGSSMAAAAAAGAATMIGQYFIEGFYPGGIRNGGDRIFPSGVLRKALVLNGTQILDGFPSSETGWGRLWLENSLYFAGDARMIRVVDFQNNLGAIGLSEGESITFPITVSQDGPLRVTLAWDDLAALPLATSTLINDLNLIVAGPGGTYLGNNLASGRSVQGGATDSVNNVEQVLIVDPIPGDYEVTVDARRVALLSQRFGLAMSAAACESAVTEAPDFNLMAIDERVVLDISPVSGATHYEIYRGERNSLGASNLIAITTDPVFVDERVRSFTEYLYQVRGVDGCGVGPRSSIETVPVLNPCVVPPRNPNTVRVASSADHCGVELDWEDSQSVCSDQSVSYELYRSTDPFFVPSPKHLVAQNIQGTRYLDLSPQPGRANYYRLLAVSSTGIRSGYDAFPTRHVAIGTSTVQDDFVDDADARSTSEVNQTTWTYYRYASDDGSFAYRGALPISQSQAVCPSLTTPPFMLEEGAELSYRADFEFDAGFNGAVAEISIDGGPWIDLPPDDGYPSAFGLTGEFQANDCGYAAGQGAFSGPGSGSFTTYTSDLSGFANEMVQLRWRIATEQPRQTSRDVTKLGFLLDDVLVERSSRPSSCIQNELLMLDGFED